MCQILHDVRIQQVPVSDRPTLGIFIHHAIIEACVHRWEASQLMWQLHAKEIGIPADKSINSSVTVDSYHQGILSVYIVDMTTAPRTVKHSTGQLIYHNILCFPLIS